MNLVDSSAWLEYFADTKAALHFTKAIEDTSYLIVPSIVLFEVFKKILGSRNEEQALVAVAHMQQGEVVELDSTLALSAASLSIRHRLPMADSIIYATAQEHGATLWTQDEHFETLPGVRYFRKK